MFPRALSGFRLSSEVQWWILWRLQEDIEFLLVFYYYYFYRFFISIVSTPAIIV